MFKKSLSVFEKALGNMMGAVSQTDEEADIEFIREALRGSRLMHFAQAEQQKEMALEKAVQYAQAEQDVALGDHWGLEEYSNMEGFDNPGDFLFLEMLPGEGSNQSDGLSDEDDALAENVVGGLDDDDVMDVEEGNDAADDGNDEQLWTPGHKLPGLAEIGLDGTGIDGTATAYLAGWETQVPGLKSDADVFSHYQLPVPDALFAGGGDGRP